MEIERRFLVRRLPEGLERYPKRRIEQAYLSVDPVIRVRRSGEQYFLTCKGRGLLSREELELPLSQEAYTRLLRKTEGHPIVKDRVYIPWNGYTIELDVFAPPFAPLMLAEVEFSSEAAAKAFEGPDWFSQEVTYDPDYTNAALSQRQV